MGEADPTVPPATQRNAQPIATLLTSVLTTRLAPGSLILEIASGSGYHASVLARALPDYVWQPSDADAAAVGAIAARVARAGRPNLRPPLALDVRRQPWPVSRCSAVVCINMIHISPWAATEALFAGAGAILDDGGVVATYGPYAFEGDFGAESNRAFDADLRARNPAWGVRDVTAIEAVAAASGFTPDGRWPMPANNHVLVFRKQPA